jgi:phosphatidylglycerophosphate synthase
MEHARLPPFESLLKSRDVEDPINLWVHRPLAYAFVALIYRTSITPNQVTLLAMLVGILAGGCWVVGTPTLMFVGGVLLWSSAILDGADGILARAKQMFTDLGRALDGSADTVVAVATVFPAFYHVWAQHHDLTQAMMMVVALLTTIPHIYLYDYYKESYMKLGDPTWSGVPERVADTEARLATLKAEGAHWTALVASRMYVDLIVMQTRAVALTNPSGAREPRTFVVNEDTARAFREHNRTPMRLWTMVSLAPHSYTISICAMFDRIDIYVWIRLVLTNLIFVAALMTQRIASRRTLAAWEQLGASPLSR